MIPTIHPTQKSNTPFVLTIIGTSILVISVFLPYIVATVPTIGQVSINGLSSPLSALLLMGSVVFGFLTIWQYSKSTFREDFSFSRNFVLISTILGILSILFYILAYNLTIQEIETTYGVNISSYLSYGIGFYGIIFGTILNTVATFVINGSIKFFPSKWQNNYSGTYNNQNLSYSTTNPAYAPPSSPPNQVNTQNLANLKPFCTNCGTKFLETQQFCSVCGMKR